MAHAGTSEAHIKSATCTLGLAFSVVLCKHIFGDEMGSANKIPLGVLFLVAMFASAFECTVARSEEAAGEFTQMPRSRSAAQEARIFNSPPHKYLRDLYFTNFADREWPSIVNRNIPTNVWCFSDTGSSQFFRMYCFNVI